MKCVKLGNNWYEATQVNKNGRISVGFGNTHSMAISECIYEMLKWDADNFFAYFNNLIKSSPRLK